MRFCKLPSILLISSALVASEQNPGMICRVASLQELAQKAIRSFLYRRIEDHDLTSDNVEIVNLTAVEQVGVLQSLAITAVNRRVNGLGDCLVQSEVQVDDDPCLTFITQSARDAVEYSLYAHASLRRALLESATSIVRLSDYAQMNDCLAMLNRVHSSIKNSIMSLVRTWYGFDEANSHTLDYVIRTAALSSERYTLVIRYPTKPDKILVRHEKNPSDVQILTTSRAPITHVCMPDDDQLLYVVDGKVYHVAIACGTLPEQIQVRDDVVVLIRAAEGSCFAGLRSGHLCSINLRNKNVRSLTTRHNHPVVALACDQATIISCDSAGVVFVIDQSTDMLKYTIVLPPAPILLIGAITHNEIILVREKADARMLSLHTGASEGVVLPACEHADITHAQLHKGLLWYTHAASDALFCFDPLQKQVLAQIRCNAVGAYFALSDDMLISMGIANGVRLRAHGWLTILMKALIKQAKNRSDCEKIASLVLRYGDDSTEIETIMALIQHKKELISFDMNATESNDNQTL